MELKPPHDEWIFLKNTGRGYELEIISSMLDQLQIPVLKKAADQWNIPSFIMGESMSGYNIYVPASRINEAREILDNIQPLEQDFPDEDAIQREDHQADDNFTYLPVLKKWLIVLVLISCILGLFLSDYNW